MLNDALLAIWFFLPAGIANVTPILVAKAPLLKKWNAPVDGGRTFRNRRIFGDHKTWRGLITGVIAGTLVFALQVAMYRQSDWVYDITQQLNYDQMSLVVGLLLAFGALAGDTIKSFFKRQINVNSGLTWFPFDQLDYIVGALLLSSLAVTLTAVQYVWVFLVWFGLHLLFSYIGFLLKFKSTPI
jgi:CDP-2,3-bis-(O-geranylgeranyl)-sn-glycerol synthase